MHQILSPLEASFLPAFSPKELVQVQGDHFISFPQSLPICPSHTGYISTVAPTWGEGSRYDWAIKLSNWAKLFCPRYAKTQFFPVTGESVGRKFLLLPGFSLVNPSCHRHTSHKHIMQLVSPTSVGTFK